MDVTAPIQLNNIFSAKGLVVVITGGGTGTLFIQALNYPAVLPRASPL